MRLLILGSDGMVGHVVQQYLLEQRHTVVCFNDVDDLDGLEDELASGRYVVDTPYRIAYVAD